MTEQAFNPSATLALYADGPAQLEALLMGLTESELDLAQTSDSWTIRQIVHHLADGDDLWKTCIKAALGNSEGSFSLQWYWDKPQTEWAENWKYANRSIRAIPGAPSRQSPSHCRIGSTDPRRMGEIHSSEMAGW